MQNTTVQILPWYQLAEPFLVTVFQMVVVPTLLAIIAYLLNKYLGIKISDSAYNRLQTAGQNSAGRIFASLEPHLVTAKIDVHSPLVAAEADKAVAKIPGALKDLGISPEEAAARMRDVVVGKLGQLQAAATPVATPSLPVSIPPVTPGGH